MTYIYGIASAVFASLMTIFMKMGLSNVSSPLATALRTSIVMVLCWGLVLLNGSVKEIKTINSHSYLMLFLASLATFGTWTCYFLALKHGSTTKVLAIDRLGIVITIILSFFILKEVITVKMIIGIVVIIIGTILVVF